MRGDLLAFGNIVRLNASRNAAAIGPRHRATHCLNAQIVSCDFQTIIDKICGSHHYQSKANQQRRFKLPSCLRKPSAPAAECSVHTGVVQRLASRQPMDSRVERETGGVPFSAANRTAVPSLSWDQEQRTAWKLEVAASAISGAILAGMGELV